MIDLQFVKLRLLIVPTSIRQVPGVNPAVLEIRGTNFDTIEVIAINGVETTDFIVATSQQIVVVVPPNVGVSIRRIEMITGLPASQTDASKILFQIGKTPVEIEGIEKLVQLVVKILLTTPGSDIHSPNIGGGFLAQTGTTPTTGDISGLMTNLAIGLSRTQNQIVDFQSEDTSIPDNERLLSLDIADTFYDKENEVLYVAIGVVNAAGTAVTAGLSI